MARQCYECKFCDIDYDWDEEFGDEYEILSCSENRPEVSDYSADCDFFKNRRTRKRKEQSNKCDDCPNVEVCGCIESTELGDTKRHYIAPADAVCMRDKKC